MDVFDTVRTMLAVREFQPSPVPPETLNRIVESAHLTASSQNGQPWHFIVVEQPETLKMLGSLARTGPYIAQAPLAIVVAVDKASRFGMSDASRAIQSMMLTAWSEGIGSNWVGFSGFTREVQELLGVPGNLDIVAIVPFGTPAKKLGMGKKKRKPLGEVASRERFGQPFK